VIYQPPVAIRNFSCNHRIFSWIVDLLEIGVNVVDWIGLAQDRCRWRALVNSVMNLRAP
jgi:hypothetical protein